MKGPGYPAQSSPPVAFDRRLKLEFHGARITSDGGLLAYRELDGALGRPRWPPRASPRDEAGKHPDQLFGLLWQAVYGRLAGYERTSTTPPGSPTILQAERGLPVCEISQTGL